jgi:hypothetical protein
MAGAEGAVLAAGESNLEIRHPLSSLTGFPWWPVLWQAGPGHWGTE